jgi:large subunit ribosomal protein L24
MAQRKINVKLHVRKDDTVQVLSGKDAGRRGKVLGVFPGTGRIVVEGVNMIKKHQKPTADLPQGGIIDKEGTVATDKVMLVCPNCHKPTRVAKQVLTDGRKVRVCKHCGENIDK